MRSKSVWARIAIIVLFIAVGLTMFTDGVRTVQILGLLACGAAAGATLARLIVDRRSRADQSRS